MQESLLYNYFRDYDPDTGRYVESDPIGLLGGSYSTYAYANGIPVGITEPLGLAPPARPGTPPTITATQRRDAGDTGKQLMGPIVLELVDEFRRAFDSVGCFMKWWES